MFGPILMGSRGSAPWDFFFFDLVEGCIYRRFCFFMIRIDASLYCFSANNEIFQQFSGRNPLVVNHINLCICDCLFSLLN
jgi:hypothetical protein